MTSIEIRHIVFDIGKVLIHYDPHIPFTRLIPDDAQRNWFFANVCTHDWNIEQDRGRKWEDAEALLIETHPDRAEHIRAFRKYWHEMVSHAYVESVAIMEALALSRPVVSTYVAGIPELVVPNETGWLVPAGSVDALVPVLEEVLSTPVAELDAMAARGRARVVAEHDVRVSAKALAALFAG